MSARKFRWSQVYESSEEELVEFLAFRNIQVLRKTVEAGVEPQKYRAKAGTTIWCAEGSLIVKTRTKTFSLQPGDALRTDADESYMLQSGISGYVCYL